MINPSFGDCLRVQKRGAAEADQKKTEDLIIVLILIFLTSLVTDKITAANFACGLLERRTDIHPSSLECLVNKTVT